MISDEQLQEWDHWANHPNMRTGWEPDVRALIAEVRRLREYEDFFHHVRASDVRDDTLPELVRRLIREWETRKGGPTP